MSSITAVGIGEVLWDIFPDQSHFGGAPANFAAHMASLGAQSFVVSGVGEDELGRLAMLALAANHITNEYVQTDRSRSTGAVDITLNQAGAATYKFKENTAWDHLLWNDKLVDLARNTQVVCFGTLGQRSPISRQTIRRFVDSTGPECIRVFDVNLRQQFYDSETIRHSLQLANVFKLNDEELPIVAQLCGLSSHGNESLVELLHRFDLNAVAVTQGAKGATLLTKAHSVSLPAIACEVKDTVGAGDAFTAALVTGLITGDDPQSILQRAIRVASFVCSQHGATPSLPPHLQSGGS